jgi:hypothetical protein
MKKSQEFSLKNKKHQINKKGISKEQEFATV